MKTDIPKSKPLELSVVKIDNDSWICKFGCYHEIFNKKCECECHQFFYLKMEIRRLLIPNMIRLKRWTRLIRISP